MRNGLNAKEKKALNRLRDLLLERFPGKITRIQLFGSKARGDADKFSDIDVLVIIRGGDWKFRDRVRAVSYEVFCETAVDISLVVMEDKKFRHLVDWQAPFIKNIQREGVLI